MADILVQFNQALTRAISWANLKARHLGWSDEDRGFWFKRDDGTEGGDPHLVPSTIGQGMGRRVSQPAHGFAEKWLVYFNGTTWVSASAADWATLATHMVVRVIDSGTFEIASSGSWKFSTATVAGPVFLSDAAPGTLFTSPLGVGQCVAIGDGTNYHLLLSAKPLDRQILSRLSFSGDPGDVSEVEPGTVYWDPVEHGICVTMENGSVLSVGYEDFIWVRNAEAGTLVDGDLVYVSGAAGDNPEVRKASNDDPAKWDCIAMVTQPIGAGNTGIVARGGRVRSLNTNGLTEGQKLYLGTAGLWVAAKPTKPTVAIAIGTVLRVNSNNGVVLFRPESPHAMSLLSDVDTAGVEEGTGLRMGPGGVWRGSAQRCASVRDYGASPYGTGAANASAFGLAQATGLPLACEGGPYLVAGLTISAPIVDTVSQIFATGSTVTVDNGHPIRPEWFGPQATAGMIRKAVEALPATGGTVCLRRGRYGWSGYGAIFTAGQRIPLASEMLSKARVRLVGSGVPDFDLTGNGLVGGTIINGPFGAWADDLELRDLGVDSGSMLVNADYSGQAQDGIALTYTTSQTPASDPKQNIRLHNVRTICKAPVASCHGILIEKHKGVRISGVCEAAYGLYPIALKSEDVSADSVYGYGGGFCGVIIKSDGPSNGSYARSRNVRIRDCRMKSGAQHGLVLQAGDIPLESVRIGDLQADNTGFTRGNAAILFNPDSDNPTYLFDGIEIDRLEASNWTSAVTPTYAGIYLRRSRIGTARLADCSEYGIAGSFAYSAWPFEVETLFVDNVRRPVASSAQSRIRVGSIYENADHASEVALTEVSDNGRVTVGSFVSVSNPVLPPAYFALQSGSTQEPGADSSQAGLDLWAHRAKLRGLIIPGATGTSIKVAQVNIAFAPAKYIRFAIPMFVSAVPTFGEVVVDPFGGVYVSNVPTGINWISLDGIEWEYA